MGDIVDSIEGIKLSELEMPDITKLIVGQAGSFMRVKVVRADTQPAGLSHSVFTYTDRASTIIMICWHHAVAGGSPPLPTFPLLSPPLTFRAN